MRFWRRREIARHGVGPTPTANRVYTRGTTRYVVPMDVFVAIAVHLQHVSDLTLQALGERPGDKIIEALKDRLLDVNEILAAIANDPVPDHWYYDHFGRTQ